MGKVLLKVSQNNSQKNTCARVIFKKSCRHACNFVKKENLSQVFSVNFEEHLFYRIPLETDSVYRESRETFSQLLPKIFVVAAI